MKNSYNKLRVRFVNTLNPDKGLTSEILVCLKINVFKKNYKLSVNEVNPFNSDSGVISVTLDFLE